MAIEKTVSELAEILGVSRQAINNRVKALPPEDTEKNEKGVTVVTRSGLIKLEEIYKKTIFEDEPVSEDVKQRELMEILVDEKNAEICSVSMSSLRPRTANWLRKMSSCASRMFRLLKRTSSWINSSS